MNLADEYKITPERIAEFQTKGHILLREVVKREEINYFRPLIGEAVRKYSTENRKLSERETYGKAFLQVTNLWEREAEIKKFVFARRFARIAADLLGVANVRLYHDQALFKEAGGGYTPWHQDQFYWNLDTPNTITMWISLRDAAPEAGLMRFAEKSHLQGLFDEITISDESANRYAEIIEREGFSVSKPQAMQAGDATFHYGHAIHCADENQTDQTREAMTIIYFADGARISEPLNNFQKADHERWLETLPAGFLANGRLNPVLS